MSNFINRYQVYCIEEGKFIETLSETAPTECPNPINHTSRAINHDLTSIIETFDKNVIRAEEDTDGYFETTHVTMNIPGGTPGDITEHDVEWPMDILLWKTILTPTTDMIGDEISVLASPETQVGVLTAPFNIGDTVLNVNPTVIDNMWRGFLITIDDGVNKDILGRCKAIDAVSNTITVETASSYNFAPGTPVKISIYILKDIYISDINVIDIGTKGFKGKKITSGTKLRVYYTNNSGTPKTFRWRPEYYNDG